ncbi:PAS domain S-box protein [Sulfuritalea sp.]|uniref:sensor domain-containing protein n=1 Tax=Sulfuritalea sp. TaxID=2480090 RepID=UPI001ACFEC69|nr:PAS domain S-box protein [Sulfuritalea sp.]MBN8476571.1 PAS domain S-box protein [Sulfuritalea sp.]
MSPSDRHGRGFGASSPERSSSAPKAGASRKPARRQHGVGPDAPEASKRFRNNYADYFEFAPSATLVLAEDGKIAGVNRAAAALLGLSREDLLNVPFERFVAPEQRAELRSNLAATMDGSPHQAWELSLLRGDGSCFAGQLDGARLTRRGQSRLALVLSDITARKQSEAALREQEEFFHLIAERLGDLVAVLDLEGRRIYNSPSYQRLFGDGRNLRGTDSFAEIHEEDRPRIRRAFAETVRTGVGRRGDYRFVLADGSVREMESMGDVITDADGRVTRVVVVSRDVTDRKLAETQLRIAATAFETHVAMIVTDDCGVILKANRAFSELTGYAAEEVVGLTPKLFQSGRHDAAFYGRMWDCIRRSGSWQGEIWNRRRNGEVYPQWLTITAVPDGGDGTTDHYVATMTDISERKAAEERIRHQALYDDLTQLPNRRLLIDRLKWALTACARNRRWGALMLIDLDHFKDLNDTHGHDHGDLLLQLVALRLAGCIREVDTAARLGGDEFVVMLSDLGEDAAEARRWAATVGKKVLEALNGSYDLFGKQYHGTPSIGITMFDHQRKSVDELLKQADLAMYRAKADGRNSLSFFDPEAVG